MKVYLDPACNISYASFYIVGLRELFGSSNVVFTSRFFKTLHYDLAKTHALAFVIDGKQYVIDMSDSNAVFYDEFLEWADIYGKVNYFQNKLPQRYAHKIVRVGANYGIACCGTNKWHALFWAIWHYAQAYDRIKKSYRSLLCPYLTLYKRKEISSGLSTVGSRSIFMVSRYWKGQEYANSSRINFIRACKRLQQEGLISFVGGMVPDTADSDCPQDVRLQEEIPYDEYMRALQKSLLVFNTPAYHLCHGWKLPEFLSQGKIILSTPFVNELPYPLLHGKHAYFAETDELSLYDALKAIVTNQELQATLEQGSREYWRDYARPAMCVKRFIDSL